MINTEKIKKATLDIRNLKEKSTLLNKALIEFNQALDTIDESTDIRIKGRHNKIYIHYINGISLQNELIQYVTELYNEIGNYRINRIYDDFPPYFEHKYNINITNKIDPTNYVTSQRLGRLMSSIDTSALPFNIKKGKSNMYHYYDIITK